MLRQKPKVQWQRHSTAKCLEQARRHEAIILFSKNQLGNFVKSSIDDISVVTLKRTDTTLDLSQKAKRFSQKKTGSRGRKLFILSKFEVRVAGFLHFGWLYATNFIFWSMGSCEAKKVFLTVSRMFSINRFSSVEFLDFLSKSIRGKNGTGRICHMT